ncbi:Imm61 family immunity protein [Agromyces sp. MMS24-JH15]|uniref:Imm61 family immunity protein n=1 Tax=Agromyces sp. MMS24-JH15 TaxID=3243765 RepID=UPI003749133A
MSGDEVFSAEFAQWIALAGNAVFEEPDRVTVSDQGGEIRYPVTVLPDGRWLVSRAERSGEDVPELRSLDRLDVERYLTVTIGSDLRSSRGYERIQFPSAVDEVAEPFQVVRLEGRWTGLVDGVSGVRRSVEMVDRTGHPIVKFSHYADVPLAQIRESFEAADGGVFRDGVERARRTTARAAARLAASEAELGS